MNVSVLNGTGQSDYLYGLISGLSKTPISKIEILDINLASQLFSDFEDVEFHKVFTYQKPGSSYFKKLKNIISYYYLQIRHIASVKPRIIHFQWLDRFYLLDRILLPSVAKIFGHKVIFTVHNVNARKRDNNDSAYNRFTLSILYKICDRLIVHTPQSKLELERDFGIREDKISVIKHGMNNKVLSRNILRPEARRELKIDDRNKVILFFGNIDYYKGLDLLIEDFGKLKSPLKNDSTLLIAGNSKSPEYLRDINEQLEKSGMKSQIITHIQYIEDEDIEKYFIASDCIVLPYRNIYQSGVIFMAYNFGLPILATKVGNFENDILTGKTGFLIESNGTPAIAQAIEEYFNSPLYNNLNQNRQFIKQWAYDQFSWEKIGYETYNLYQTILDDKNR